jgi:hypothetical protein
MLCFLYHYFLVCSFHVVTFMKQYKEKKKKKERKKSSCDHDSQQTKKYLKGKIKKIIMIGIKFELKKKKRSLNK